MTVRVVLGLGSNLGNRVAQLRRGIEVVASAWPDTGDTELHVSGLYETDPVGGPEQGAFLNCCVRVVCERAPDPWAVLEACRAAEADADRVREVRWGPRTLDVDVLWIDGVTMDHAELTVPHPRTFERDFVLVPLHDVAPDLVPAGWDRSAASGVTAVAPADWTG